MVAPQKFLFEDKPFLLGFGIFSNMRAVKLWGGSQIGINPWCSGKSLVYMWKKPFALFDIPFSEDQLASMSAT